MNDVSNEQNALHTAPVVINCDYGGFGLSDAAEERYLELCALAQRPIDASHFRTREVCRHDPLLAQAVQELGTAANGVCAKLAVRWVHPVVVDFVVIDEYDGTESLSIDMKGYKLSRVNALVRSRPDNLECLLEELTAILAMPGDEENDDDED